MYDILGTVGLAAALDELTEVGIAAVADRAGRLAQRLRDGLADLGYTLAAADSGPADRSAIVSISCPEPEAARLLARLAAAGIQVSIADGLIRISPHYWTEDDEIELILTELRYR
jgi:selenocysteine lyase/cysteine desulfurase